MKIKLIFQKWGMSFIILIIMAHGENAKKKGNRGKEFWKSRYRLTEPCKDTKVRTHKFERRSIKQSMKDCMKGENENF